MSHSTTLEITPLLLIGWEKKSSLWGRQTFKEQVEEEEPAKEISIQENVLHQRKERMYFKEESSQHKILQINEETKLRMGKKWESV